MDTDWKTPWLVAVWPGMGGIAQIAGRTLVHGLRAQHVTEVPVTSYFDVRSIKVHAGLILPRELPESRLLGWKNPGEGPDLLIFLGDAQPSERSYAFCNEVLDVARELGVTRVFTFAAMATQIRPEARPRVFAGATHASLLAEVRRQEVEWLDGAEVSGLNGVLLAAAAERDMEGICLLGEFPFFASSIANPKASAAVLRVFASLAGITLDLTELDAQAERVERMLTENLRRLEQGARLAAQVAPAAEVEIPDAWTEKDPLDPEAQARIEALFAEVEKDRSRALELKAELERHGVFAKYEDRFLDLFKKAD